MLVLYYLNIEDFSFFSEAVLIVFKIQIAQFIYFKCTNLKSVNVNFDPTNATFPERGQHVQDRVEATPPGGKKDFKKIQTISV